LSLTCTKEPFSVLNCTKNIRQGSEIEYRDVGIVRDAETVTDGDTAHASSSIIAHCGAYKSAALAEAISVASPPSRQSDTRRRPERRENMNAERKKKKKKKKKKSKS
jgi:hypothetical protein